MLVIMIVPPNEVPTVVFKDLLLPIFKHTFASVLPSLEVIHLKGESFKELAISLYCRQQSTVSFPNGTM